MVLSAVPLKMQFSIPMLWVEKDFRSRLKNSEQLNVDGDNIDRHLSAGYIVVYCRARRNSMTYRISSWQPDRQTSLLHKAM